MGLLRMMIPPRSQVTTFFVNLKRQLDPRLRPRHHEAGEHVQARRKSPSAASGLLQPTITINATPPMFQPASFQTLQPTRSYAARTNIAIGTEYPRVDPKTCPWALPSHRGELQMAAKTTQRAGWFQHESSIILGISVSEVGLLRRRIMFLKSR